MNIPVETTSDKKLHMIANTIVFLLFVLTFIAMWFFFMKNFHGGGWIQYQNSPFPTDQLEYRIGGNISYNAEIKRTNNVSKTVGRTIQSACGDVYDFPPILLSGAGNLGEFSFDDKTTFVPDHFRPCPRAWINGTTSYKPNSFRTVSVNWKTEEFKIVK